MSHWQKTIKVPLLGIMLLVISLFIGNAFGVDVQGQSCLSPPAGLVSWWPGDGNATDITDSNDGALQGNTAFVSGKIGQAFSFGGGTDHVNVGNPANLNSFPNGITLEAWVNPSTASSGLYSIVTKWGQSQATDAYALHLIGSGSTLKLAGGIGVISSGDNGINGGVVPVNQWTHVAMTYDTDTGVNKLYINGTQVAERIRPGGITQSNLNVLIGREDSIYPRPFKGLIDEASIYNRPLSASEIAAIFNAGYAGKCKGGESETRTVTGKPGIWIANAWMWKTSSAETDTLANELSSHEIKYVYVNVGSLNGNGAIDLSQYGTAPSHIIDSLKSQGMVAIAWINGETGTVDITQTSIRNNIAALTKQLTDSSLGYSFDGVQLDLEPIPDPSRSTSIYNAFKQLIGTIRTISGMGQDKTLSIAAPAWESKEHSYTIGWDWFWQGITYRDIALLDQVDQIASMSYDVNPAGSGPIDYNGDSSINGNDYSDYIGDLTKDILANLTGTNCKLSIGMPVYATQPKMHIGNLADGLIGISKSNISSDNYDGISLWELGDDGTRYMDSKAWYILENGNTIPNNVAIIDVSTGTATGTETIHQVLNDIAAGIRIFISWFGAISANGLTEKKTYLTLANCEITLKVYRPNKSLYGTYHITDSTESILVANKDIGNWEYQVTTTCSEAQDYSIVTTRFPMVYLPAVLKNR